MPKGQVNETIAHCPCPYCGRSVPVRRNSAGKLYQICDFRREGQGGCGMLTPNLRDGQEWIQQRMTSVGEKPKESAPPKEEPKDDAPPKADATKQKPEGLFSGLLDVRLL